MSDLARRLALSWTLLAFLCAVSAARPVRVHVKDTVDLQLIRVAMTPPGVSSEIIWEDCGMINAFYFPLHRTVIMCNELDVLPDEAVRFFLAHELAHGVICQLDVPFTGSHEAAADELAAYVLVKIGRAAEVEAMADYFLARAHDEIPWDDHPGDVRRGLTLKCIAAGPGRTRPFCNRTYDQVRAAWGRLLGGAL